MSHETVRVEWWNSTPHSALPEQKSDSRESGLYEGHLIIFSNVSIFVVIIKLIFNLSPKKVKNQVILQWITPCHISLHMRQP